jgi:hypothetical protein
MRVGTPNLAQYTFNYSSTQPECVFIFEDCRVQAANQYGHFTGLPPSPVRGTLLRVGASDVPVPMLI